MIQTNQFQFGLLSQKKKQFKPVWLSFLLIWLYFFDLARFFSNLSRVFSGLGSVLFFRFQTYKTETELVGFFKILIDFFSRFGFFSYFFSGFLDLIGFSNFLLTSSRGGGGFFKIYIFIFNFNLLKLLKKINLTFSK